MVVLGILLAVVPAAAWGQTGQTPAPPAEAEAYAAQLQLGGSQVAAVGHTEATAGGTADTAHAGALEIGPEPPPAEQFGGTQTGPGASSGNFIDTAGTGFDQLGRIAVLPWSTSVTQDAAGRHARAHAGVLELLLAPGGTRVLELRVLTSDAAADYTAARSTSRGATDGVVVILGDPSTDQSLSITILHSEASSEGTASTYLIRIGNGPNEIATIGASGDGALGDGLAQICSAINIPGLLRLLCVQASGGLAEFAQATLGDGAAQGGLADLLRAQAAGGSGGAPAAPAPQVLGAQATAPAPAPPAVAGAALAATGMGLAGFAAAMGLIGGAWMIARVRRLGLAIP